MVSVSERFDYPYVIDDVINEFVLACHQVFAGDKLGILLVGSSARGELSWTMKESMACFYSDIEFIVVVEKMDKRSQSFSKEVADIQKRRDLGKRFKIDYVLNDWDGIARLDKKIFVFDSKNTGIELGDQPIKPMMPNVNKNNINFHELNDVLLHRMKALLMDVPDDLFYQANEQDNFCLSIAKNTLDITTWLFPYEAEELISGFENRLNSWERQRKDLKLSLYFGDDEFSFLRECIAIRRGVLKKLDAVSLLEKYISIYAKAINYCKFINDISSDEPLSKASVSSSLFLEFSFRRRLKEASLLLVNFKMFGLACLLTNIFTPRKGRQIEFCFLMIEALSLLLTNQKSKHDEMISQSKESLGHLLVLQDGMNRSRVDQWLGLRDQYRSLTEIVI